MSDSSLRKASSRFQRVHRERHQPAARAKRGLLEKKRDYLVRARDHHAKQQRLKTLAEKAAFKNPDEFYHRMERAQLRNGTFVRRSDAPSRTTRSQAQLREMKGQDAAYVAYKQSVEQRKRERLQADLHFVGIAAPEHMVFVDSDSDVDEFDAARFLDTHESLVGRAYNRPTTDTLEHGDLLTVGASVPPKLEKERAGAYKELTQRLQREEALKKTLGELHVQRQLMGKGGVRAKKRDNGRTVYRWSQERKK